MHRQFVLMLLVGSCCFFGSGCANKQLQKITVRQAKSVSETYEQQVLDNLAMFVENNHAIPFFSVYQSGTNAVNDNAKIAAGAGAFTEEFWKLISGEGSRQMNQGWTLTPVAAPNRLRLMQCAYQRAVGAAPEYCQKCCEIEDDWYGKKNSCSDPCGITCGWLQVSTKWKDVPKCCHQKYGHHCGTYVWVEPCYEHEFSKLVMKIVEYASNTQAPPAGPPTPKTKEVRLYYDDMGKPATVTDHAWSIVATMPRGMSMADVEKELNPTVTTAPLSGQLNSDQVERLLTDLIAADVAADKPAAIRSINKARNAVGKLNGVAETMLETTDDATVEAVRKQRVETIRELEATLEELRRPPRDFGPPTQFNNLYGPDIYQLQQRLNNNPIAPPN